MPQRLLTGQRCKCCGRGGSGACSCLPATVCLTVSGATTYPGCPDLNGTYTLGSTDGLLWDNGATANPRMLVQCQTAPTSRVVIGGYATCADGTGFGLINFFRDPPCPLPVNGDTDVFRQVGGDVAVVGSAHLVLTAGPCPGTTTTSTTFGAGRYRMDTPAAGYAVALPCVHRSAEPHTVRDGTGRQAFTCGREVLGGEPFGRLGLDVFECTSCGVPADRRCGPGRGCPGYEPWTLAEGDG